MMMIQLSDEDEDDDDGGDADHFGVQNVPRICEANESVGQPRH